MPNRAGFLIVSVKDIDLRVTSSNKFYDDSVNQNNISGYSVQCDSKSEETSKIIDEILKKVRLWKVQKEKSIRKSFCTRERK